MERSSGRFVGLTATRRQPARGCLYSQAFATVLAAPLAPIVGRGSTQVSEDAVAAAMRPLPKDSSAGPQNFCSTAVHTRTRTDEAAKVMCETNMVDDPHAALASFSHGGNYSNVHTRPVRFGDLMRQTLGDIMHEPIDDRDWPHTQFRVVTGLVSALQLKTPPLPIWPARLARRLDDQEAMDDRDDMDLCGHDYADLSRVGFGGWLTALRARNGHTMEPTLFRVAPRRRLLLQVFLACGWCPFCASARDRCGDHALTCPCKGDGTNRHSAVRSIVWDDLGLWSNRKRRVCSVISATLTREDGCGGPPMNVCKRGMDGGTALWTSRLPVGSVGTTTFEYARHERSY